MSSSIYTVNKSINKPIEFKGIKAQYIMYLAVGLVSLLILFSVLYFIQLPIYICVITVLVLGAILINWVMRYSHKYGEYGLIKEFGYRRIPPSIHSPGRHLFTALSDNKS